MSSKKLVVRKAERSEAKGRVYTFGLPTENKNEIEAARGFARACLQELDAQGRLFGLDPATVELRWDRRAGCGCGCSPGFVLPTPVLSVPEEAKTNDLVPCELFFTAEN